MATSDSKTRLWDLANLSMIREESRVTAGLDFRGEDNFLGAIHNDRFLGIWNAAGLMFNGVTTLHMPVQVYINQVGDRAMAVTEEVTGDEFEEIHTYYLEIYDIANLGDEPVLVNSIYILTVTKDMLFGAGEEIGFSLAISEDGTLALVGPSGDRPVKLINMNDGSTIREFYPPVGKGERNIGAAGLGFTANVYNGMLIGWAEGYAELWRRVAPSRLDLNLDIVAAAGAASGKSLDETGATLASTSADKATVALVQPGQILRLRALAAYVNGDKMRHPLD